jgi:hypothetical protein
MRRGWAVALPLAVALLLAGCEGLFELNLFSGLQSVQLPDLQALQEMGEDSALDYLEKELASPTFVAALGRDAQALADVRAYLDGLRANTSTDNGKRAAILYAELYLQTTGGARLVNNAAALLLGGIDGAAFQDAGALEGFLESHLAELVPPEALSSKEAFEAMLDGFSEAWNAYDAFGSSLNGDGDPSEVPAEVNLGDVAQKALFACVMSMALNHLYGSTEEARQSLWDMARGEDPTFPASGSFSDPFAEGTSLDNILDEAGISFG